jgi:hypothetical protein
MRRNAMFDYAQAREAAVDMGEMMLRFNYEVLLLFSKL